MNIQELTFIITKSIRDKYRVASAEKINLAIIAMVPEQMSTRVWAQFVMAPLDPLTNRRPPIVGVVSGFFPPKALPSFQFYRSE
jgi:hypothetical protein